MILRRAEEADCADIFDLLASDSDVINGLGWDDHPTMASTDAYVEDVIRGYGNAEHPVYFWLIRERISVAIAGVILVDSYTEDRRVAEVDYALAHAYRGKGYAPEALRRVIEHLFLIGFYRVEAVYNLDNHASGRVMEKVGMRYKGILRGRALRLNEKGLPDDLKMRALLASDSP